MKRTTSILDIPCFEFYLVVEFHARIRIRSPLTDTDRLIYEIRAIRVAKKSTEIEWRRLHFHSTAKSDLLSPYRCFTAV